MTMPLPRAAQTETEAAAQNMPFAGELCLRNQRTESALPQAFAAAGFALWPLSGSGAFKVIAPSVTETVSTVPASASCDVQSPLAPLPLAEVIGRATAERLVSGKAGKGAPEHSVNEPLKPCESRRIFAPQELITISYAAAGNSGACLNDGARAILIKM